MIAEWVATIAGRREVALEEQSDHELVERTKAGDMDAFSVLVRRCQSVVYNLAFRFMRDSALAEDMSQEAFLKAFRLLNGFRGDCSFSTWMYRVTCSVCLTELNKRKRRDEVELLPEHGGGTSVDDTTDRADLPEIIRRSVSKLPENYATVITLYYLKEVPYEEIAATMNVPMGTLKTWMHRARQQLREIVEKEHGYVQ
jgi:RNA polymerase sigma-70 factor (ECF subfamily)